MERPGEGFHTVWLALPFALVFPALIGVIEVYHSSLPRPDPRMSATMLFVAGAAVILLLHSAAVHRVAPRAGVAAALGLLVWSVPFAYGHAEAIGRAITDVEGAALEPETSPVLLLFGVAGILGSAIGLTVLGGYRSCDRWVSRTAWAASGIGAIVVVLALLKSGRPDPDTYLDSLWPDGWLELGDVRRIGGHDARYERREQQTAENETRFECRVTGIAGAPPIEAFTGLPLRSPGSEPCPKLRILVDRRGDLMFLTEVDRPLWMFSPVVGLRVSDAVALRVSAPMLADRIAAPLAWRIGGAASVAFGLLLLGIARRLRRRAASLTGRDAHHEGEGWVTFGFVDAPPVLVPVAASLRSGPIVLLGEEERPATYREAPSWRFRGAAAGTLAGRRTQLDDFAANLAAIALAVVVVGVTPLVVARFYWI